MTDPTRTPPPTRSTPPATPTSSWIRRLPHATKRAAVSLFTRPEPDIGGDDDEAPPVELLHQRDLLARHRRSVTQSLAVVVAVLFAAVGFVSIGGSLGSLDPDYVHRHIAEAIAGSVCVVGVVLFVRLGTISVAARQLVVRADESAMLQLELLKAQQQTNRLLTQMALDASPALETMAQLKPAKRKAAPKAATKQARPAKPAASDPAAALR